MHNALREGTDLKSDLFDRARVDVAFEIEQGDWSLAPCDSRKREWWYCRAGQMSTTILFLIYMRV